MRSEVSDTFCDPDPKVFIEHLENECREVFAKRGEIPETFRPAPTAAVADVSAEAGLFTRLLGSNSGPEGEVIAIDFKHLEGENSDWKMDQVRAGREIFEAKVLESGFRKADAIKDLLKEGHMVVFEGAEQERAAFDEPTSDGRGRGMGSGRGKGAGRGMGTDPAMRADQDVFHYLLERHKLIRREVKNLHNGVETITESEDAVVSSMIQEHVAAMHERVKTGRGLRFWDDLFVVVFKNHDKIKMVVENTERGVKVTETSDDAYTVKVIQAHAVVVSMFVKRGFDEAHESHPVPAADSSPTKTSAALPVADHNLLFPIIEGYGGVVAVPDAVEPPRAGMKLVLDVTSEARKPEEINKGLDRAARLLNLYGAAGLKASDVRMTVVLHGEATKSVLSDEAWESRFQEKHNPSLSLIRLLQKAGVDVIVCGQALSYKKIDRSEVAPDISVAVAALTVLVNRQADGFSYVSLP